MHSLRRLRIAGTALFMVSACVAAARGQEPAPAPPPPPAEQQQPPANPQSPASPPASAAPAPAESSSKTKHTHAHDFLILGTVFTPNAYAFPNVHLRIRRAGEKKFRWETYTNSRGEFAVRVPQGLQYEVVIVLKGFADQSQTVDARSGISEDSIVFRMEPAGGKK
jgi:hypothetical protein